MGDDHRRYAKKGTGTVPKIKCRNNARSDGHHQNFLSNDLGLELQRVDFSNLARNSRRNFVPTSYSTMSSTLSDEQNSFNRTNGIPPRTLTPSTSGPTSRRDSIGNVPKCDNVAKYPDKKQIEDKLNQIREYIRVTMSLMSAIKNEDQPFDQSEKDSLNQTLIDLKDSEAKLVEMLKEIEGKTEENVEVGDSVSESGYLSNNSQRNELDQRVESARRELDAFTEQQNTLLALKHRAENKLRDARLLQEKLLMSQQEQKLQNHLDNITESLFAANKNQEYVEPRPTNTENLNAQVNLLQERLNLMHTSNDARNELIDVLDKRDALVLSEQAQLHEKLVELQNKKTAVDRLVSQLQNAGDMQEEDDIGSQVRKICTMKEQLAKLRDMYELVKGTESVLDSHNTNDSDNEENARALPVKADNVIQNCVRGNRGNQGREKQVNKNLRDQGARPKVTEEMEKLRLQAELQAKKRELEEIMCKHKAGTSNLNHDVGGETKPDFGNTSNSLFEGVSTSWYPVVPNQQNRTDSSDRYSSDDGIEGEANEYAEISTPTEGNSFRHQQRPINIREDSESRHEPSQPPEYDRFCVLPLRAPFRSTPVNSPTRQADATRSSTKREAPLKNQVQKQLELIRNVCDSLLEQQNVRNNLSPSPLYSEVAQYPNASVNNPGSGEQNEYLLGEIGNYQSLLTTNTLQTQAFMLNTLNQCCQMLWLQQRELVTLRNSVAMLQERFDRPQPSVPYMDHMPPMYQPPPPPPHHHDATTSSIHQQPPPHLHVPSAASQKTNHVSSACSLPNLIHHPHHDPHAYHTQNNMQNARLLESGLNNVGSQPLWNGQALNNQVVPGNRANNYWDNFRSYSRQNLLSTKSNEGTQNSSVSFNNTSGNVSSTQTSYLLPAPPKSNRTHRIDPLQADRRKPRSLLNPVVSGVPPPDVLNINHNQKSTNNESVEFGANVASGSNESNNDVLLNFQPLMGLRGVNFNETSSSHSVLSEDFGFKESSESARNRNEWHDGVQPEDIPKSKLFEDLHENVYKEVASLISANQGRLHFLLHLFRDLRLMSSDPLRSKTLQSIHTLITSEQQNLGSDNPDILSFLERHDEDVLHPPLIDAMVDLFAERDDIHGSSADFRQALWNLRGKKISDVRLQLLNVLSSFMRGQEETGHQDVKSDTSGEEGAAAVLEGNAAVDERNALQNDDLAEADQTQYEMEIEAEEGAVGGVLSSLDQRVSSRSAAVQMVISESELAALDFGDEVEFEFEFGEQGLDQVPTRLTNRSSSGTNTPSKERTPAKTNTSDNF